MNENTWAIRDIKHGKTFFFKTWEELQKFVVKQMIEENSKLVDEICKNHGAH